MDTRVPILGRRRGSVSMGARREMHVQIVRAHITPKSIRGYIAADSEGDVVVVYDPDRVPLGDRFELVNELLSHLDEVAAVEDTESWPTSGDSRPAVGKQRSTRRTGRGTLTPH